MYYIYNNEKESLYAGEACGCIVWKLHYTRAVVFNTKEDTQESLKLIKFRDGDCNLEIVTLAEWESKVEKWSMV